MEALELKVPPPIWAALFAAVVYGINLLDLGVDFSASGPGLGIGIAFVGVVVAVAGMTAFARVGTTVDPHDPTKTDALVVGGVYRRTRNPMYLGLALLLGGFAIALGDIAATIVGVGGFVTVVTRVQIQPEERLLGAQFGRAFEEYCEDTRRWF
ncbi:MAG: methyltransferase [Actinomycetota bacterium]